MRCRIPSPEKISLTDSRKAFRFEITSFPNTNYHSESGLEKTAQSVNQMNWPRKVFLESTALFQLGSKLETPEFAKLLERQEHLKFDLLVSEVSWAEYPRGREANYLLRRTLR
jgi:hypothetical protein